jgi:MFS family permease
MDQSGGRAQGGSIGGFGGTTVARAWFAVLVLCIAQIVSTVDRGMLALVIDPVRADLGISEVQIALLQGFAFAVFYVSIGIPLGFVADAVNRRRLLVAGILVWSAATILSGFADTFWHMFAARLMIGVGEAVLGPCAVGMIAEMFVPNKRGRPMALYVLGSMVAYGVGSAISGLILEAAPRGLFAGVPVLAGLAPWRIAFVVVGLAGFPLALFMLLLRDPANAVGAVKRETSSPRATVAALAAGRHVLLPLYGAVALFALGGSVASGWNAVMLTRLFGTTPAMVGQGLGVSQITWALFGALLASVLVDQVGARYGSTGRIVFAGLLALATIPSCIGFTAPTFKVAVVMGGEVMFTSALFGTTLLSVLSDLIPMRSRGVAVALYSFVMTMIGASLGPLAVAGLTERVFGSPVAVGWSMTVVGTLSLTGSFLLAIWAARRQAQVSRTMA